MKVENLPTSARHLLADNSAAMTGGLGPLEKDIEVIDSKNPILAYRAMKRALEFRRGKFNISKEAIQTPLTPPYI